MKKIDKVVKTGAVALVLGMLSWSIHAHQENVSEQDAAIKLMDAQNIALQEISGTLLESELEYEDGVLVWEIKIRNESSETVEVEVDAQTGAILDTEIDDD